MNPDVFGCQQKPHRPRSRNMATAALNPEL